MDIAEALEFVRSNHHAVLATRRADGSPQLSPIACGVDADGRIVVSSRETAMKVKHLRARPARRAVRAQRRVLRRSGCRSRAPAEIVSLPEAMDGLVEYYRALSGEHPDWDDYRAAMERERRVLIRDHARSRPVPNVSRAEQLVSAAMQVGMHGQRRGAGPRRRAAHAARAVPARGVRAHRHEGRLRHVSLRRVHGAASTASR